MLSIGQYDWISGTRPEHLTQLALAAAPKSVQSVRFAARSGYIRTFQPKAQKEWKRAVKMAVSEQLPVGWHPFGKVPLWVQVTYVFPPLKSFNKADKAVIDGGGIIYKDTRPDVNDNLNKGLFDALTGVLWEDDGRVVSSHVDKVYGKETGILISVGEMPRGLIKKG